MGNILSHQAFLQSFHWHPMLSFGAVQEAGKLSFTQLIGTGLAVSALVWPTTIDMFLHNSLAH